MLDERDMSHCMLHVSILKENSLCNDVTCGVPQASILGPLLFMLCIDDICDISDFFDITMFADDTTII